MVTPVKLGVYGVLSLFSAMLLSGIAGVTTSAMEASDSQSQSSIVNQVPLTIEPICSDADSATSFWKVNNQKAQSVQIDWDNFENDLTGTYVAPEGISEMETGYVESDPNNTTSFTYQNTTTTTNATKAACDDDEPVDPPVECVDGSIQQNVTVMFSPDYRSATIQTVGAKPLCEDVTVFFSSYIMPRNYNGQGFENNPTAYPQQIFSSQSAVLMAGTNGLNVLTIDLPNPCENVQVDVYYAPEIRTVGPEGHGAQNILSHILQSTDPTCGQGMGGGEMTPPVEPPVTQAPAAVLGNGVVSASPVAPQSLPSELPYTGPSENRNYMVFGILLAFITYVLLYRYIPYRQA